jgi:hypothetical protein
VQHLQESGGNYIFGHSIGAFGAEALLMAEIVNLRIARKRVERSKAEGRAAENRQAYGASKRDKADAAADRKKLNQVLDSHRIEPGDRR